MLFFDCELSGSQGCPVLIPSKSSSMVPKLTNKLMRGVFLSTI